MSGSAIDCLVGRNIRVLRLQQKMSQNELAGKVGVTFQQIQKYEKGATRVGAGRLLLISNILGAPVSAFFEGGDDQLVAVVGRSPIALLTDADAIRLAQAFTAIESKSFRVALVNFLEELVARAGIAARSDVHFSRSALTLTNGDHNGQGSK